MSDASKTDLFLAINELSKKVDEIKEEVGSLDSRVEKIEIEMKNMRTDIRRIDHKLNNFNSDLGDVRADISILQEEPGLN